jgi:hypothetical protein|tara:strand:- start:226 stop:561 length:336 start_codon:yes stop_codon:yes gene_type:complete
MRPLRTSSTTGLLPELRKRFNVRPDSNRDRVLQDLIPDTLTASARYYSLIGGIIDHKATRKNITQLMLLKHDKQKTGFIFGIIAQVLLTMFIKKVVQLLIEWYRRGLLSES